ncbi:hypothetical protein CRG98_001903 [Punica granatum]|uniref:Retrotransposon gag domain-containing protein n=1 Tax=Punica granatum TaxID=22663 RepID=A0A2I0LAF6_PUNGR|nr:hypothetical protein CRG98_001903 [Punica granatum]
MPLSPKIKVPDFQKYDGTSNPRHHLLHYRGKMLQYWEYEQFVVAIFQESLSGPTLNWMLKGAYYSHFMGHKATFFEMIIAGKQVDLGIKLGRIECLDKKKEGESSRKTTAMTSSVDGKKGRKIAPVALAPNFNPTTQNQNLRCEYRQGALGHTTDNCWKLREKIQDMIEKNQISFNAVKPPNVQANSLPDRDSTSDPTVNIIGAHPLREDKTEEE